MENPNGTPEGRPEGRDPNRAAALSGASGSKGPETGSEEIGSPPATRAEDWGDRRARLLEKARSLPKVAGVYLMKGEDGHVLYVGKASILPNRVSSYFVPSADLGPKKQRMLDFVRDFDVIECEGEWEALLMESRLVKDIRPRFNARLADDKTFPYLVVTLRDDFPGVFITRNPTDERFKGARVFGPFTSVWALRQAVQLLQRVFRYRTCELDIADGDPRNNRFRPCLLHAIGQCTAPCANRVTKGDYRADIDRFIRFLGSKRSVMLRELREEMAAASADLAFERAAVLRDQIKAIEKLDDRADRKDNWQPETEVGYVDPKKALASLQRTLG
ncbi:MAG: UvrB/UvrC motif-containing protein, partial [Phycisphaerales bacterium]|nr:UvrB/UvrC motif-containing protein [Phycisphaerales bacterium]